jgi:hypothetical protein
MKNKLFSVDQRRKDFSTSDGSCSQPTSENSPKSFGDPHKLHVGVWKLSNFFRELLCSLDTNQKVHFRILILGPIPEGPFQFISLEVPGLCLLNLKINSVTENIAILHLIYTSLFITL